MQFFLEKCEVKLLERGENEIMCAETKEFQAMYKHVRIEGKVALGIKARFKQQKGGYEIFYYEKKSMFAYEHKFIIWFFILYKLKEHTTSLKYCHLFK